MKKISILGCGWLGSKIAAHLQRQGNQIKGSYRSENSREKLLNAGIAAYKVIIKDELSASVVSSDFFNCDILIISLSPSRKVEDEGYFEKQIEVCGQLATANKVTRVLFLGSTSVYANNFQVASESDLLEPTLHSGLRLKNAESYLQTQKAFSSIILRLGGLIGYDRNPMETLKRNIKAGSLYVPVNLVHADDVVLIIAKIIERKLSNEIYNLVCNCHPLRIQYYGKAFHALGIEPGAFNSAEENAFKLVDNSKVRRELAYTFKLRCPTQIYDYIPVFQ